MKTAVLVPCKIEHIGHLPNLCQAYLNQTIKPDFIHIGISGADVTNDEKLKHYFDFLYEKCESFLFGNIKYKITFFPTRNRAGKNRNLLSQNVEEDLVFYQDADDLPHSQRIEGGLYFFRNFPIVHLLHGASKNKNILEKEIDKWNLVKTFDNDQITKELKEKKFYDYSDYHYTSMGIQTPFGVPVIRRYVLSQIQWRDIKGIEDQDFNRRVFGRFHKSMIIDSKLYWYNK